MAVGGSTAGARVELNNKWGYIASNASTNGWNGGRNTNNSRVVLEVVMGKGALL